jgi:predicted metal-dependent hydrolase
MTLSETSTVHHGGTAIPYAIRRSIRRKTITITVDPDRGVVLAAPWRVPVSRLDRIVHERSRWIVRKLRELEESRRLRPPHEFSCGESFLLLGRPVPLHVVTGPPGASIAANADELYVAVPEAAQGDSRTAMVRAALAEWYRAQAEWYLPERVALWHWRVGVPMPGVIVKTQHRRWGSCDARGTLRLNWRVVQAPLELIDYVIVHELVHLRHRGHQKDFWEAVGAVMPDYPRLRDELRELGEQLDW